MAAASAFLLLMALGLSFACCFAGVRALFAWCAVRKSSASGRPDKSHVDIEQLMRRVPFVQRSIDKAQEARQSMLFKQQMPDAIRLLCIALDSGSSLVKALEYAAENTDEPLATELKRTVWDLHAGQGFDEAMVHLRERTGGSEFAYLAVAMEIQHQSGGSLTEVLQTISGTLRRSAELSESLVTQTTQGRLSARVVAVMPVILLLVFSVVSPGYLGNFFSSPIGVVMLVLAVSLELGGIFWVRRTLRVDLSAHLGGGGA